MTKLCNLKFDRKNLGYLIILIFFNQTSILLYIFIYFLNLPKGVKKRTSLYNTILLQTKKFADVIIPRGADNHGKSNLIYSSLQHLTVYIPL